MKHKNEVKELMDSWKQLLQCTHAKGYCSQFVSLSVGGCGHSDNDSPFEVYQNCLEHCFKP